MSSFFDDPALFRSVLENLPIGIYILDREPRIRIWSRGAEQLTGYLAHEVVGQACRGPLQHCDRQGRIVCADRCPVTATLLDGHPQQAYVFSRHKRGHRFGVQVRTLPLFDDDDFIAGVAVVFEEALADSRPESLGRLMYGCLDAVTGIPSQRLTRAVLAECIAGLEQPYTGAKRYAGNRNYSNWELSADRANAARRLMQESGLRADQVAQVRWFADQRLRTPQNPLEPSNRRISIIVQYVTRDLPQDTSSAPPQQAGKPAKEAAE